MVVPNLPRTARYFLVTGAKDFLKDTVPASDRRSMRSRGGTQSEKEVSLTKEPILEEGKSPDECGLHDRLLIERHERSLLDGADFVHHPAQLSP